MSEMIERVAQALMIQAFKENGQEPDWTDATEDVKAAWRETARTAIEAIREPTEEMEKAGAREWDDDWGKEQNALNMWQAMIDEALR